MTVPVPETGHFGFTRVAQGEDLSKNGYAALDLDRVTLDDLFYALQNHQHDNTTALADPSGAPTLTTSTSGGSLPAGTTLYYRIAYIDRWALETGASNEASVTTTGELPAPTSPAVAVENTGGGIGVGTYSYGITFVTTGGGETVMSQPTSVQSLTGTTNRIRISLPSLPTGATTINIYRAKPGQSSYYYLSTAASGPFYDTALTEDQTVLAPVTNTTNATNSVSVTVPGGTLTADVFGWKIYRATDSGDYAGYSLVHTVVETTTEGGGSIVTSYTDTGDVLQQGFPRSRSATMGGGKLLNLALLQGSFPLNSVPRGSRVLNFHITGAPADSVVYGKTRTPTIIQPAKLTAFFQTLPTGLTGATPPQIRLRVQDSAATPAHVDLICADNSGYYVAEWPLTSNGIVEAETGTRSDLGLVPLQADVTASNGQVVSITTNATYVQVPLGILDAGTYSTAYMASVALNGAGSEDLTIQVYRTDNNSVLATLSPSSPATGYSLYTGPSFTTTLQLPIAVRFTKSTTGSQTYLIDYVSYTATLTSLAQGDISLVANLIGSPSGVGADVTVSLWF